MGCSLTSPLSSPLSRRSFFRFAAGASALASFPVVTERLLAQNLIPKLADSTRGIHLDANENPLGPCEAARRALVEIVGRSGRYLFDVQEDLRHTFAKSEGVKPELVAMYPGSSGPLHYAVMAYCAPGRPVVVADPGYEAPIWAARQVNAESIQVPLADPKGAARHDVKAMLAASATPGLIYVCNPNNPTGTATPREDLLFLIEHAPKGTMVMIDEAYIHLSEEQSVLGLVEEHENLIVLRTFSKLYGMAGLRLGAVAANPAALKKIAGFGGLDALPVTAAAAGKASLLDAAVVPGRRKQIAGIRQETLAWLKQQGYAATPAVSNCFMVDVGRPADAVRQALAEKEIFVGRKWAAWPNHLRVTVGTAGEMAAFRTALAGVLQA